MCIYIYILTYIHLMKNKKQGVNRVLCLINNSFLFPLASPGSVTRSRVLERKNVGIGTRETEFKS